VVKKLWKDKKQYVTGIAIGAVVGYLYWYFQGCENGCSISGSPLNSSMYFAMIGGIAAGLYNKKQ
jgi:hypothetical protein